MAFTRPYRDASCLSVSPGALPLLKEEGFFHFQTTLFFTLSNICMTLPAGMQPSLMMVMPPCQRKNEEVRKIPEG